MGLASAWLVQGFSPVDTQIIHRLKARCQSSFLAVFAERHRYTVTVRRNCLRLLCAPSIRLFSQLIGQIGRTSRTFKATTGGQPCTTRKSRQHPNAACQCSADPVSSRSSTATRQLPCWASIPERSNEWFYAARSSAFRSANYGGLELPPLMNG
jgi:hypothetical protein